jgi:hypothetical protein
MRILRMLLVVATFLCLLAHEGVAASRQSRERAAKKACLTGDPVKGVEILADLFIETNELAYIFNQGRCFEQNRRYEDAIGRFREFLIKGSKETADDKAEAEKHIAACQSYLDKSATPEPAVQEPPKHVPGDPPPQIPQRAPAPEPGVVVMTSPRKPDLETSRGGLRIAGLAAGGLGIAGVVTGLVLNLKANSMASDLEKPESFSRSTDSNRKDYKIFAWVSYGVGTAFAVGGAVMYYLGWEKGQESPPAVAVVPVASTNMVGTMLTGEF